MLVAATIGGCATTDTTGALQGQAGPFAWESNHVRQTRQEDGREITWWFTLVLRNTGASVIALQRVATGMIAPGESWGGQSTEPFVRRVKPGDEIRLDNQTFTFRCRDCDRSYADSMFRQGIVRVLQFEGEDEQGRPVRALVRIRLDSSTGPVLK
jgi:hypothetical protein